MSLASIENFGSFLTEEEIKDIIKSHLKIESNLKSIESLFNSVRMSNKINYEPYYQRNYVWDKDKATYFIESILLGTEIPPLVFFNGDSYIEVIDGRQRYETIKKFIANEFSLGNKGLSSLKELKKHYFKDLPTSIQDLFWDTKIRIIEFSIVNEPRLDDRKEDLIKKEIFRRYNSGITPLKGVEIEKAKYIDDDLNGYFKQQLQENREKYKQIIELFFPEKELSKSDKPDSLEKVLKKLRLLFVQHNIPISYYSMTSGKTDLIDKFFQTMSYETEDIEGFYQRFSHKIDVLYRICTRFKFLDKSFNHLVFECLYWATSILEVEKCNFEKFVSDELIDELITHISNAIELYRAEESHFYKNVLDRYTHTSLFFAKHFNINFDIYLYNSEKFKLDMKELRSREAQKNKLTEFESFRLNKPDPSTKTIEDICRDMNRSKFLLRPSYQRSEAISKIKSSALIESIILGIKVPPIFIYKREDGVSEVVDGQQRILSILGFIGEPFMNELGIKVYSDKNKFSLTKLKILTDLEKKSFEGLERKIQDKILDFNLSIVEIDSKLNPDFDPIDLFIRLNNKPFPIKEHSFEMWNSYVDRDVITSIKQNTEKHSNWFYFRLSSRNSRMQNEEMYSTIAFLEYRNIGKTKSKTNYNTSDQFLIFQKVDGLAGRIKDKNVLTQLMNDATTSTEVKDKLLLAIKATEKFINKTKTLLISQDVSESDPYLKRELEHLISPKGVSKRTLQNIYLLWYILAPLTLEIIIQERASIRADVLNLYELFRQSPSSVSDGNSLKVFKVKLKEFWDEYSINERKILLSEVEKKNLIKKQDNTCSICLKPLFYGDDIHVDHIDPLAKGGRDSFLNLKIAHKLCNLKKGSKK